MKKLILISFYSFIIISSYAQGYVIDSMIIHIKINKNGLINVKEKIFTDFIEKKRGIYRDIPTKVSHEGNYYSTSITNIKCNNHEYKLNHKNGVQQIKIGNKKIYLTGKQMYDISFDVDGPFIQAKEHQEFYWNVVGTKWNSNIDKVKFTIDMPDDHQVRYNNLVVYTGNESSTASDATIQQVGRLIFGETNNVLQPNEGVTIAIKLPVDYIIGKTLQLNEFKTYVHKPKEQMPYAAIPAGIIALLMGLWLKIKSKNENKNSEEEFIVPNPYPPVDLNPAEVGTFNDHIVHDRDVLSLLPYWASQGFLKVRYDQGSEEMYFEKIKPLDQGRPDYENYFFNELFSNRESISLSDVKYEFSSIMYKTKSKIYHEIKELKLYDDEYSYWFRSWRIWALLALFIPLTIASFILGFWLAGALFLLGVFVVIMIGAWYPKLSDHGLNINRDLKAFYQFLKSEDHSIAKVAIAQDAQYFEKVYPYAVALNLDKRFMQMIKPLRTTAPIWYYYGMGVPGYPSMDNFSNEYSPKEITSVFSSIKGGTSSGGGFSGGSVGGGFGGGGGGSW